MIAFDGGIYCELTLETYFLNQQKIESSFTAKKHDLKNLDPEFRTQTQLLAQFSISSNLSGEKQSW